MPCDSCDKKPKNNESCAFTKATVEINNPKQLSMFRKVVVPASMGDDVENPPKVGKYCNVILYYEANDQVYLYSSDGIPTRITVDIDELKAQIAAVRKDLTTETTERKDADQEIWTEIETIEASSDVVDVVGTYAELQQYDTSKLHDNDLIKVLQDETHNDAITYYRWSTSTSSFSYVGAEGPYYTASETDTLLAAKQDTLIAGANIQIAADGKTISATDTTYTHFTGATASTDGVQGLVPGPLAGDQNKVLKGDGTWGDAAANTIFYMNASESGGTRHIYKNPDMTGAATSQEVFDANDKGQVILRISTSVTPDMYSDCYLQNAYKATGDYQLLFLDEKTYRSFDTTTLSADTFTYSARVLQDQLTAGTNIQINGNTISATDTTYNVFDGATYSAAGTYGLVPAPARGEVNKVLKGDATWEDPRIVLWMPYDPFTGTGPVHLFPDSDVTAPYLTWDEVSALQEKCLDEHRDIWIYRADSSERTYQVVVNEAGGDMTLVEVSGYSPSSTAAIYKLYPDMDDGLDGDFAFEKHPLQDKLTAGSNITITNNTISATDTTYSNFGGATSSVAGSAGLVPAPTTSDPDKYLKGDGTWAALPGANNISSNDWSALWL